MCASAVSTRTSPTPLSAELRRRSIRRASCSSKRRSFSDLGTHRFQRALGKRPISLSMRFLPRARWKRCVPRDFPRTSMKRREFIGVALTGSAALFARGHWAAPQSRIADARIEILTGEPIGTISPNIYSHFVEHLGGVVYDGIWVGEDSKVPNV